MKFSEACLLLSIASLGTAPAANADQPLVQLYFLNNLTVNGQTYSISSVNPMGWYNYSAYHSPDQQPWWGDQSLAQAFAKEQSKFTQDFPVFLWSAQPSSAPTRFAATVPSQGGSSDINWSLFVTNSEFRFAVAKAPRQLSIVSSENLKNNKTSNLGTTLLPQFEGGTLTVDQANQTYSQDFTLSSSTDNAINNNGYSVKFSGIFSDAPGESGNIAFRPNGNYIEISGRNTYTGITIIDGDGALFSRNGAIPDSSDVYLFSPYSRLAILGGDETIASLNSTHGNATVDLEGNNLFLGSTSSRQAVFTGLIQDSSGQGNITKTGSNLQALTGTNTYTGSTSIQGGTLALTSGGSISQSRLIGVDQGAIFDISNTTSGSSIKGLSGTGSVVLGAKDLAITGTTSGTNAGGGSFGGVISGTGGLTIDLTRTGQGGSFSLNGTNTYTGSTSIESGNLLLDGGSFSKVSKVTVKPGARLGILSGTNAEAGGTVVGGPGARSHLDINGTLNINGDLNLDQRSRTLFNSGDIGDPNPNTGARSLLVTGTLFHNGESIDSRGANYAIDVGELRGNSNILIDGETLTLTTRNNSLFDGRFGDFNTGQQGGTLIKEGAGNLTLSKNGGITNLGNLIVNQGILQLRSGSNQVNNLAKINGNGILSLSNQNSSLSTPLLEIEPGGSLNGVGTINGDVVNEGTVSPGNSIGTLTVNGSYLQGVANSNASLNIEVNGTDSDLLKIAGDNRIALLRGNLNITSYQGAPISANKIYTAIDVTGSDSTGGARIKTNLNVVGSSGFTFARETDPFFAQLDPAYYATCTSSDPNIQKNCTKLQFAWVKNNPKTSQPLNPTTNNKPGTTTIADVKKTGGAITTASSGNPSSNTNTCTSNGGSASTCQQQNKPGTGASGNNNNTVATAKAFDAGWASVSAAVTSGVTGGSQITNTVPTQNGSTTVNTGYTTNQTKAALVTPDFVNVISALFAVPTRQQLNQALHSITAEPYASMQSVALEAMEQFRANTLALTSGTKAIPFIAEEEVCTAGGNVEPGADGAQQPQPDCKPHTVKKLTPWSLLIDGTNTQATLNGTNDLASLDYNIFSSAYGLQYDFNRNWSAGAAFGYGRANLYNYEYADVRIDSSTYSGAAWGIYRPSDSWKFTALAGYMNLQYESDRNINFGGLNRNANANWSGNGFTAALAAEYDWVLSSDKTSRSAVRIKPNTFFSYALHNQGAFSETGAESLNLALNSHTADSLIYGIGFQIETPIVTGQNSRLIPRLSLGYEYDFNGDSNEEHQLTASFAEVPALGSIDVLGQNRGANALDVGLSLEYETSQTLSLYAGVGGAFWSNGNELSYGGGLKLRW